SGTFLVVLYALLSPVYILTTNLVITQFIFLFVVCNLSLITLYSLARYIGMNKLFSVMAAILYLANPYSIFYIWRILNSNIILYSLFPLVLLSIVKIVRNDRPKKYIFVLILIEFLSLP